MQKFKFLSTFTAIGLSMTLLFGCTNEEVSEPVDAAAPAEENEATGGSEEATASDTPKNVIVMVGDGMGLGQMEVARLLEYGKEGELHMESLEHTALLRTYSANNWVTDSAAAGTAIATSTKTDNGMIGVNPDGESVASILELFRNDGKQVGIISNNTVTDATPAAFTANVETRAGQDEIARQLFEREYDLMLGGGSNYFQPDRQDGDDLVEMFEEKGYSVVTDRDELLAADSPERLLGLFHPAFMNYKVDMDLYESNEPTLNEMTDVALDMLSQHEDGFFLMVEGARIDHASHAADITSVWQETIEFDNTVADVLSWMEERDDTLLIVLADHETMGIAASEVMDKEALRNVSASPEYMVGQFEFDEENGVYLTASVQSIIEEYSGVVLSDEEVKAFNEYIYDDEGELRFPHEQAWEIGSFIADHYQAGVMNRDIRAASATGGHTGNMVPVFATGLGADRFNGVLDNTDISHIIAEISQLETAPGEVEK
ncbi:alkaline phosphatase [Alkalihalophilus lindianensis]|uniref:Alkaline phosphatase n=1 Tax=Alkalihalophilus lindianensis TaxID=1630542 RepID=A0ABU3X906_9BACI|nr:alkaline phosphatase [Alkalihalophilus lindianensis]MDV2684365.1 alkaline phosphatase [Alkalihalophilus lindianensis]